MRRLAFYMVTVLLTVSGVSAQDQTSIDIAISDDPGTLNPLVLANPNLTSLMWSRLLDVDTETGALVAGMANSWEISSDGLTYTVHLRDDLSWSDGTPITAADYAFALQAIRSESLGSPLSRALPPEIFDTFTIVDDQTFSFSIARPNCSVLTRVNSVFALPSHMFAQDLSNVADNSIFTQNGVSSGPYTVVASTPGTSITLSANPNYWKGAPLIPDLTLHIIPDAEEAVQALDEEAVDIWTPEPITRFAINAAREVPLVDSNPSPLTEDMFFRSVENGIPLAQNWVPYQVPSPAVTSLVLNTADPENPQPRYDASGNRIDQGVHPILGDASVRRAIGLAAHNYEASSSRLPPVFPTNGNLVTSQTWAFDPDLSPYVYSAEEATALLEEAGWVDDDNDPSTPRVCEGCQYTTDGEPLSFELTYDPVRPEIGWVAEAVQQQLEAVGAEVTLVPNDVPAPGAPSSILNQDFDMALITLGSFPTDPSFTFDSLLFSTADVPGRGFNIASYANDQVDQLLSQARSLPGCEPEARAELYQEAQAILSDESVYIPLGMLPTNYVANERIVGFDPAIGQPFWNIERWAMDQPPGS